MIIPSKFNGYVNGVRLYNGGGSGGGASASVADSGGTGSNPGFSITGDGSTNIANAAPAVAPWGTTANSKADYYNTQIGAGQTDAQIRSSIEGNTQFGGPQSSSDWDYLTSLARSRAPVPWGNTQESKAAYYNSQLGKGQNDAQIRSAVEANPFGGAQSNVDWNTLIQTAAMNNSTGRPLAGSGQFYQPVYQGQYQNYNTGNSMGISQYGQQPPSGIPQMQNPFSMYGGQMMGGGYGQFGDNNPYSPYSNSFLNMPSNLNQSTMQGKANFYGGALNRGFNDQQLYNQASGLFGQQSPTDWNALQNAAMEQQRRYAQPGQDYRAVTQQQMQQQQQNQPDRMLLGDTRQASQNISPAPTQGFGSVGGNFADLLGKRLMGDQYQNGQSTGFAPGEQQGLLNMLGGLNTGQPLQGAPQQNQPIFSRSSMARRTGPIRNYEEGGIASLLDTE
jgi:hypothetical protein